MERATLARPYADAVAKLAGESNAWGVWSDRLGLLALVTQDEQVQALAGNPSVAAERVAGVILGVCGDKLGPEGANLVGLLAENKRLALMPEIVQSFEAVKAAREGLLEAHVTTAFELGPEQMAGLIAKLEAKFGCKITATQSIDPELIGGVMVQVGDEVMDASVRGGLANLAVTLKA